jgi:hypothetical protein
VRRRRRQTLLEDNDGLKRRRLSPCAPVVPQIIKMRREKAGPSFFRLWRRGVAVIP